MLFVPDDILVTRSSMPSYEDFIEAIKPLWDSHWLTNMGRFHRELEERLAEYLDVPRISLTVNGHMALELAIQSFGFPKGAQVITTPFTFISTTHAIVRNGLEPVFCDVKDDGTIDETKIDELVNERTAAILPVHVYGTICADDAIEAIADRYGLKVIYDAAHAFGVRYRGAGAGRLGDASIFSFHATKAFNTIEGGAVVYREPNMHAKLADLKNFGIRSEDLVAAVGANAKMNEFCAVMGLLNLKRADEARASRAALHAFYKKELSGVRGIRVMEPSVEQTPAYAYFPIVVGDEYPLTRDELYEKMKSVGVRARKYFYPLTSDQACFKNKHRSDHLDRARDLSKRVLSIPFYEGMGDEEKKRVIGSIYKNVRAESAIPDRADPSLAAC